MPDFFISHADGDLAWAEWIAAELEGAGYGVIVKAWDFRPGENRVARLDEALATSKHTICVLTKAYVDSEVPARTAAQLQQFQGKERALIPVQVDHCQVPPLMAPIIPIDLSDVEEADEARRRLLDGVAAQADRAAKGGFPRSRAGQARFPHAQQEVWELRGHRADPYFIGRDDDLAMLHRAFRATSAVQVITGLGGLGKTCLAVEYAIRYAAGYDLVWWIRAEDPATMRGDYVELAQELGLPSEKDDQAIAALRRELRRRRNWLLIFDNAEAPDELFPLLPDRHSGHVLVTSLRREWPYAEVRRLDALPGQVAAEYLQRKGRVTDSATARDLADALGCLPLALAQAASVIADGLSAADYLELLREQSPGLFAEGRTPGYGQTVDSTWRVSVDRLARRSPAAVALFRMAAFLSADAIPLGRLTAGSSVMPSELAEALASRLQLSRMTAALGEYSLAETVEGQLSIHRLVQAVTRTELGDDEPRWAGIALAAITAAFPRDEKDPKSWEACEEVMPHALVCAGHAIRLGIDAATTVQLLNRVAIYLLERGRNDSAAAVLEQGRIAVGHLDRDERVCLSHRNIYGRLLLAQGDITAGRTVLEEVYTARTRVLEPRDPDTLRAGLDFAAVLYEQGHWAQAEELNDQLVERFTDILGADDVETITAVACQGSIFYGAGRYTEARTLLEKVTEARTRLLGAEHPDTLSALSDLTGALRSLGQIKGAVHVGKQLVDIRARVLGPDHPSTLVSRSNFATVLYESGELRQARTIGQEVVDAGTRLLGADHPNVLNASSKLAFMLRGLGDLDQARAIGEQVVESRTRLLGVDHPGTLSARDELADTLRELGELDQARAIGEQVVESRTRLLGVDHPDTLSARDGLAATLRELGELDQARAMGEQVVKALTGTLGADNPLTLDAQYNLVMTLFAMRELEEARVIEQQVVESLTEILGKEHHQTMIAVAMLATILVAQGKRAEAFSLLSEFLEIAIKAFGKRHTAASEIAWQLVQTCNPHEIARRRALIVRYLAWLVHEPPDRITGKQKNIREDLRGTTQARKNSAPNRRRPPRRKKKHK